MTVSLSLVQGAYIVAGLLFILALAGLSRHETASAGNRFGIIGMALALVITIVAATAGVDATPLGPGGADLDGSGLLGLGLILVAMVIGALIGLDRARAVEMTGMPELIAMLHSFVGLTAVLVGWNSATEASLYPTIHDVEVSVGVFIGAVTFTGSIVAYLKLSARISSAPLTLPGRNALNLGALAAFVVLTVAYAVVPEESTGLRTRCSSCSRSWPSPSGGTSWHRSAAATCQSSSRCSTATPAGPPPPRASCSETTCSSSPARSSAPRVPTCRTSCAGR